MRRPSISPDDQTGVLEHLQVLRDGRLRERELVDELAAVAGVVGEQQPHDPHARRVAERLREDRDLLLDASSRSRGSRDAGRGVVAGRRGDAGRHAAQRLDARDLVRAGEVGAGDA